jgi:putative cofactor-binding repeat protein
VEVCIVIVLFNGGGLYLEYSTNTTISGSVYSNSAYWGGGLYLYIQTTSPIQAG